jgi:DNA phosphorothioation-dependent restriction protein DptH
VNYLAQTIVDAIVNRAKGKEVARFVLPSYPSALLLRVGIDLEERLARIAERRVALVYGIARRLGEQWEESDSPADRASIATAREKGWYNKGDNLTSIRNQRRDPTREDCLVALIAGYDHMDDQASLRDFFHLDDPAVWTICLRRSFKPWVEAKLRHSGMEVDGPGVDQVAVVMDALYAHGLADLPAISRYLDNLDISSLSGPRGLYRMVLGQLAPFNLPRMTSLADGRGKDFASYLSPAQEFLNYSQFLDDTKRKKAIRSIENYRNAQKRREPTEEERGEFASLEELLASLDRYVDSGSEEERRRLLTADFPLILDGILGYRKPRQERGDPPRVLKVRKLSGLPPEVFLRAIWLTLSDYVKDAGDRDAVPEEELQGIALQSRLFRHDFDADDEEAAGAEGDNALARAFLRRVLGGLDDLLERHVELTRREGLEPVKVTSRLCPGTGNDIAYSRSASSEPHLAFDVLLSHYGGTFKREFLWSLPQNHQSRLLDELLSWASRWFHGGGSGLPAFVAPYVPELFQARDEDEVNRLTGMALGSHGCRVVNLLAVPDIGNDPVMPYLQSLSVAYQNFLLAFEKAGFFAAVESEFDGLRGAYEKSCEAFLDKYLHYGERSCVGPLLFKAFSLFDAHSSAEELWVWREYAECSVVTPLHPALLEMLRYQYNFLCESFSTYAAEALKSTNLRSRPFNEGRWNLVVDLARVERPLFGTIRDGNRVLDSTVRGYGYLHLMGSCHPQPATAASRLLLEYDSTEDDEEIDDGELFRETRVSKLVQNTLLDYRAIHPHANDGLSIGAYCGGEVQPVVAGIDRYLERTLSAQGDSPYGLSVVLFSEAGDDSSVTRWLNAWRDRWQAAEMPAGKSYYAKCNISIACRVVPADGQRKAFANLLRRTPLDLIFFTDFVSADSSDFDPVPTEQLPDDDYRKFPVLEKACSMVTGGGMTSRRQRILSNRRFELAALHAEVMARLKKGPMDPKLRHLVVSTSDFMTWRGPVDAAHEAGSWVICIDPTVDERLLRSGREKGTRNREIIGFGTGVGAHGEANYTVSTEQFAMTDVKKGISSQLAARLQPWDAETRDKVADSLVREAAGMAGLSVVRATGRSEYVRDYISYATVRKLLPKDPQAFCDELVSLDAFRHWFDDGEDRVRPDLLRLRATIVDGFFQVEAQVLECKLAQQSEDYLSEAGVQVEAGLKRLSGCMRPRESAKPIGLEDRPDQRYWWMQLHRLIASRGVSSMPRYSESLAALERLGDGYFDITWQGAVIAFWTDLQGVGPRLETQWSINLDGRMVTVPAFGTDGDFVRRVCLEGARLDIFSGADPVNIRFHRPHRDGGTTGGSGAGEFGGTLPSGEQKQMDVDTPQEPEEEAQPAANHERKDGGDEGTRPITVRTVPDRILLGSAVTGGKDVYWEFGHRELPNRHILVFGASGTGKTYTIQALLCELGKVGLNTLIVDYTNGFTTSQMEETVREKLKPRQHVVRREPLPINPFRRQTDFIDEEPIEEDPANTAQRVTGVFAEVYMLGDQQKSALYTAIRDGITKEGGAFTMAGLMARLDGLRIAGGTTGSSAGSVISKIQPFVDMKPFGQEDPEGWEKLFNDDHARCHVIQLAGFSRDTARLITEFSLIELYRYYRSTGSKDKPRVIVLDEVQNLDHSLDSPLGQLLTEGRKFGISLILATQTLSNLDKDQRDRLFQASHKLFFKPADTELRSFAQVLESATGERADDWVRRLSSLSKGECYSLGPAFNESNGGLDMKKYFRIRIKPLRERF